MLTIHVWSDYVCPFCLIADELIDRAITDHNDVEIVHHPHELRRYPTPTLRPEDPYLPNIWQRAVYPMARRFGVALELPAISPQPHTALAFRGAQIAEEAGLGPQYHRRILTAFFRENLDIGNADVLTCLAADVGIDTDVYRAGLVDPDRTRRHEEALIDARAMDITVVPTLIIGNRRIEGVPSESVIQRSLEDARRASA